MNDIYKNTRVGYMIEGAKQSRYNASHWFRYLRKIVDGDKILLLPKDIEALIASGELTMFQIVTLKRAVQPGTITNIRVANLNRKTTTPMVRELMRKHKHV